MKTPAIDQLRFVKDVAIFEKSIIESIRNGDRTYYKPVTVKSMNSYEDPMRIQGIKASLAWNMVKSHDYPIINLEERNAVDIAKVIITKANADKIADSYPDIYQNIMATLDNPAFKDGIKAIAIPLDIEAPKWLNDFIDYDSILKDNISGFPFESIGVMKLDRDNVNYTNMVQL